MVRQNKSGVQKIKAKELVPGDVVHVAGIKQTVDCQMIYVFIYTPSNCN